MNTTLPGPCSANACTGSLGSSRGGGFGIAASRQPAGKPRQRTNADNLKYASVVCVLVAVAPDSPLTWRNSTERHMPYGMTLIHGMTVIPSALAAIPALVTLTVVAGRIVGPLAREARFIVVVWLALRGTRPDERADIIRALTGAPQQALMNEDSARRLPAANVARPRRRVPAVASDDDVGLWK